MKKFLIAAALVASSTSALAITPFSLPWKNSPTDGGQYKTTDHPDGVFVLEFLANFCGACNDNADNVNQLADAYKGQARVQVLDMSLDTSQREIQTWIAKHSPNHPVLQDVGKTVWNQINMSAIPTTVIMDCKGDVKFTHTDVWDDAEKQQIRDVVDGLLAQSCN